MQRAFGFSYIKNCPPTPEATQELLERIGPIRNTHYGASVALIAVKSCIDVLTGGFYDFTSDLSSKGTPLALVSVALFISEAKAGDFQIPPTPISS